MIEALIMLGAALLVLWIVWYIVTLILGTLGASEPVDTIAKVIFLLIALLLVLRYVLPMFGIGFGFR